MKKLEIPADYLRIFSKLLIAVAIGRSLNISLGSEFVLTGFTFSLFFFSGSTGIGIAILSLALSASALTSSLINVLGFGFDVPFFVFFSTLGYASTFLYIFRTRMNSKTKCPSFFELQLGVFLFIVSFFLRKLTHLETTKLFAMLLPEDNAAWIHASSGFIRYEASAGSVAHIEYGVRGFLSNLISFISVFTELFVKESARLTLINVANTYVFVILLVCILSACFCHSIFNKDDRHDSRWSKFFDLRFSIIVLVQPIFMGTTFLYAGHLSLITSVYAIWFAAFVFTEVSDYRTDEGEPLRKSWSLYPSFLVAFAIGSSWFPLIPVSYGLLFSALVFFAADNFKYLRSVRSELRIRNFLASFILVPVILVGVFHGLQLPNDSISNLIGYPGGTNTPSRIALTISFFSFVVIFSKLRQHDLNNVLFALLGSGLIAYSVFSLFLNPGVEKYSIGKFSMLIGLIGLPIFLGSLLDFSHRFVSNFLAKLTVPFFIAFGVVNIDQNLNDFPRTGVLDSNNWQQGYLSTLLKKSDQFPKAHILCLGSDDSPMQSYICSRFGSALQFREYGDGDLARRWRSQLLGESVEPSRISDTDDFLVPETVEILLQKGGSIKVILVSGTISDVLNNGTASWVQRLPLGVIESN
jgi:hypothetical protein